MGSDSHSARMAGDDAAFQTMHRAIPHSLIDINPQA
jgi:hypothetical protein